MVDLAKGHVAALQLCLSRATPAAKVYNLGTGNGYSRAGYDSRLLTRPAAEGLPYVIDPPATRRHRRSATPTASKAYEELGWKAEKTLDDMCADSLALAKDEPQWL